MRRSIAASTKKRGRKVTTGKGTQVVVRLHPPLLTNIEVWIEGCADPKPTRAEAIRRLVATALQK
jgi:hypothetical protein